jgi:fatty-acyl-CoA synthase
VEDALSAHPGVAQAAVIGVPDAEWGEAVMAVVVPRQGRPPEPKELLDLVRLRKGRLHVPKRIEIVDEVPLTPLGKIDKKAIRSRYWEGSARQVH